MNHYTVLLTIQTLAPLTDEVIEDVAALGGAAGGTAGKDRLTTTITVKARGIVDALQKASELVARRAPGDVVDAEVATVDEHDRREEANTVRAELVGLAEIAELLGITRQRVSEMHRDRKDFPMPVARLRSGPVWRKADLSTFADGWQRKPGRPRKVQPEISAPP